MTDEQLNTSNMLENVDALLLNMDSAMQFVGMGMENMANGEEVNRMLCHFRNTLQDARALLDDAHSAMMRIPLSA